MTAVRAPRIAPFAEGVIYRVAGFPIAIRGLGRMNGDPLLVAFVHWYWHPRSASQLVQIVIALLTWPVVVLLAAAWYTSRNGRVIELRGGKTVLTQFGEQIRVYFTAGVLAPWYYIFSLYEDAGRARTFIQRFESKCCYVPLLKAGNGSPLNDKHRFAIYCAERQIRCVETLLYLDGRASADALPRRDLFVKPSGGRGGRGAERWDRMEHGVFAKPGGEQLAGGALLARLLARSRRRPLLLQPRVQPHPALSPLTVGALPTVRLLTCLDEHLEPEVIAAIFRTSVGDNVTVDNLHAGGIAALVDLHSGVLSACSNLGADARLGWITSHPDTGAQIEGFVLPCWAELKLLAVSAHRHFTDRVIIGWDIAIADDGPALIEGNGNPDFDIVQRFMRAGLRDHRLATLMRYHLERASRGFSTSADCSRSQEPAG